MKNIFNHFIGTFLIILLSIVLITAIANINNFIIFLFLILLLIPIVYALGYCDWIRVKYHIEGKKGKKGKTGKKQ